MRDGQRDDRVGTLGSLPTIAVAGIAEAPLRLVRNFGYPAL
jgi:hypothetical protein